MGTSDGKPVQAYQENKLDYVLYAGMAVQSMMTLTGGAFLTAYALHLGANNFQIGILASIPLLTNIFQLLSIYLVKRYSRKSITVLSSFIGRSIYFIVALIPLLIPEAPIIALIVLVFILQSFLSISTGSWSSWMQDLIPSNILGAFISKRMRYSQTVGIVIGIVSAISIDLYLDLYPNSTNGYSALFLLGAVSGSLGVVFLTRIPEPEKHPINERFLKLLKKPFKLQNFRRLIIYNGIWNFAVNIAAPFFTVYLLEQIGYSLTVIMTLTTIMQISTVMALKLWGHYADDHGYKSILSICVPLYLFSVLAWVFATSPEPYILTMPILILAHITMGIAGAGTGLSASSLALKLAPKGEGVAYLSVISFTNAIASGIAPIIGGLLSTFLLDQNFEITFSWENSTGERQITPISINEWDSFFVISFIIGMIAFYRLAFIEEEGTVKNRVLLEEISIDLQREMRNVSQESTLRSMIGLPMAFFDRLKKQN